MLKAKIFHALMATSFLTAASVSFANQTFQKNAIEIDPDEEQVILIIRHFLKTYVDKDYTDDRRKVFENALKGAISQDPHSEIYSLKDLTKQNNQREGKMPGVGLTVRTHEKGYYIERIRPDGPASQSGLATGDIITHIDGKHLITQTTPGEAIDLLRGNEGSVAKITVERNGAPLPVVNITRATLKVDRITSKMLGDIGYIKIPLIIGKETAKAFKAAVEGFQSGTVKPKGLVIDLRGNPGGNLVDTTQIADMLIDDTGPIVHEVGRSGTKPVSITATPGQITNLPITVLVDKWSGSGAELLSAALQDYERATIFGEDNTYGKGTVQRVETPVTKDWGVRITIAQYFSPKKYAVQWYGITPDVRVKPLEPSDSTDYQAERDLKNSIKGGLPNVESPPPRLSKEWCEAAQPNQIVSQIPDHYRDPLTRKPDMPLICAIDHLNRATGTTAAGYTLRSPYTPPPPEDPAGKYRKLWTSPTPQ